MEAENVAGDELIFSSQFKIARCLSLVVAVSGREDKSNRGEGWSFILKVEISSVKVCLIKGYLAPFFMSKNSKSPFEFETVFSELGKRDGRFSELGCRCPPRSQFGQHIVLQTQT